MMFKCPHCKKSVKKKAKFCGHCGAKIAQDNFNFGDENEDALKLDIELITDIMHLHEEGDLNYDIDLVSNIIDLHISESELNFGTPLLQIQLEIAEKAIDSCIANGYAHIEFISGKGEMILYNKILSMLKGHQQIGQIDTNPVTIIAHFKKVK